ncbi:MAG: hypothetical protein J7M06_06520 [Proteobacteria bacterium]|nr:hypothetical protein [Pseudomonadota bacterium]
MKRRVVFIISILCLILFPGGILNADQRSFEEEILEILKEKNIITQEQYQGLTYKLKTEKKCQ